MGWALIMAMTRTPKRNGSRYGVTRSRVTPASMRGLQQAIAALSSDERGPTGDEALAILEQRRRDDDARRLAQGCLPLRPHTE